MATLPEDRAVGSDVGDPSPLGANLARYQRSSSGLPSTALDLRMVSPYVCAVYACAESLHHQAGSSDTKPSR